MTKIYIVTHQKMPVTTNELLEPIQVGTNPDISPTINRDNVLDNISSKNPNFCELTATYWMWKNIKDVDVVGICHYRRYFNFFNPFYNIKPSAQKRIALKDYLKSKAHLSQATVVENEIKNILNEYDIILSRPYTFKDKTITSNYCADHRPSDWELTKSIIIEKYPDYKESVRLHLDEGRTFHIANMLICKKELFDAYHEWLFSILFELETRISLPEDPYQARIFGFISERLINLYVYHNNLKIKAVPIYKIEDI